MNFKGELCQPRSGEFSTNGYGTGVGAAEANGGILICGGQNNIFGGTNKPKIGGKVRFTDVHNI